MSRIVRTFAVAFVAFLPTTGIAVDAAQQVRLVVRVPADTPVTESIYLAGSLPSVGGFQPDGVKLARQIDGTYSVDLPLEPGQTLEFKITRGSWLTVEKNAEGGERTNRQLTVDSATKALEIVVERWADADGAEAHSVMPSTVVGTLKLHAIKSQALGQSRTIRVWLPAAYETNAAERYAVLYLHDGQNCFDRATSAFGVEWQIDETLTRLIAQGRVPPLIVVGLDNGLASRIDEYTYHAEAPRGGGAAAKHADFVMKEVKPFIDATYRTAPDRAHTYVGGSSLGGLISLELARRHNGVFGGAIAMSPALWWADESLTKDIERDPGGLAATRIWIDMGTRENLPLSSKDQHDAKDDTDARNERLVEAARRLDAALAKHDVTHRLTIDDQHAEHNEAAWAARFPTAIEYLLAPPPTPR